MSSPFLTMFNKTRAQKHEFVAPSPVESSFVAHSAGEKPVYGLEYYLKGALAGGICCSATHGGVVPVDVVKTRMQLEPGKFSGMVDGFKQIMAKEGTGGLLTGLGPTVVGYFIQGWFKFGGVEFFKINQVDYYGEVAAWEKKTQIYLLSAACAEFIADIFLCPLEATRIRLVSNPEYASGLVGGASKILAEEGFIRGFYSGFGPILLKQIPYTMCKFAVQGKAQDAIGAAVGCDVGALTGGKKLTMAISSGLIAGVAAAIVSHPADTLMSKVGKAGAGGTGSIVSRLGNIAAETGLVSLCTNGLGPRCIMIGSLTAGQFAVFDIVMDATGAAKFHFHDPSKAAH